MPNYDYKCTECAHQLEIFHKLNETPDNTCPQCKKQTLQKSFNAQVGLTFVGDGFYKTMYGSSQDKGSSGGCCPCGKNKNSCSSQ